MRYILGSRIAKFGVNRVIALSVLAMCLTPSVHAAETDYNFSTSKDIVIVKKGGSLVITPSGTDAPANSAATATPSIAQETSDTPPIPFATATPPEIKKHTKKKQPKNTNKDLSTASHAAETQSSPSRVATTPEQDLKTVQPAQSLSPVTQITATSGYTLRPGDKVNISVWKEEELDRDLLVMPDGTIDFPLIGTVNVEGQTTAMVQQTIKDKLKPFIPAATVSVEVMETGGNVVSVIGQVNKPGDVVMNRDMTVIQALSQAGGLTSYADEDLTILRKTPEGQTSIKFDYSDIARGKNLESNIKLMPGDVIVVPTAGLF